MKKLYSLLCLLLMSSTLCNTSAFSNDLPYYPSIHCTKIVCIDGYQYVVFIDPITGFIDNQSGLTQIFHKVYSQYVPRTVPARCTSVKPEIKEESLWEDEDEME